MFDARPQHNEYLRHRAQQFRQQVERRLDGSLTEDEFRPLRLMNGVYLQLHAYMLRVAIPYGTISPDQMRTLALLAEKWDKGYGHWTTRQNIQYNWPKLVDIPDMLDALADVGLHAIQTSGNTIRNVTTDAFAGAAADEVADPRPYAELLRQWSTDHGEFQFLPRKFKIAVSGGKKDRAVIAAHDIGLRLVGNDKGELGYQVWIGGGLGRTPLLGQVVREFLPEADLLPYVEAIIAAYNLSGRRDNKYKARIKITVAERGLDVMREEIEAEFLRRREAFTGVDQDLLAALKSLYAPPAFRNEPEGDYEQRRAADPVFRSWTDTNLSAHKQEGYASVTVTFKAPGQTPGDASAEQMRLLADLAERFGHHDLRISHEQNVVLPHVHKSDLFAVYQELKAAGLATANAGLISDIVACPGMDYCTLATARSIPIAQDIAAHFRARGLEEEIGQFNIRISGCINACGHHHLGHIGILGLDRAGVENYQITLGGDGYDIPAIGQRAGAGFPAEEVVPAIDRLIDAYLELRESPEERFIDAYRRLGVAPFKAALYPADA
ncbi:MULTISPECIES: nitrite/sulfite reductase [Paracoccus]|jgi:sulfite reductase (NADPH) hemoprotein beta-component|uniref:Nitrite/sulfite reductase, hemoprotein beta-component, ferrodoxin domain protein n=1 Tax=Paracoccus denitrificans (strain Pd 1222) TaxID=318586 RepID=A1AZS3_PARDP|nr:MULTISPECIES: nitrite/sulfite reductase [Paracoccus]ABL68767.1 nitrite/sulfite reductase, hemoprotein beta-component, ferrodoxin domain protein [Paracoccus denitrificans PD1222]MBB4625507.1 sulfite reductase (NADPH) hemoprotein beta-component [Paracoccus denitrificans]MCU7427324.1 nitrite/sulfite reductase [Paracoccus denitrificans]QAR26821.1 nitrite/sulfite reductase [Paracoccus denitrificans]UFS64156.1 nitrite/sulfite reductase [Paracoccus denitrificans]